MGPILYASVFLIVYNTEPTVFAESVCSSSKIRERELNSVFTCCLSVRKQREFILCLMFKLTGLKNTSK